MTHQFEKGDNTMTSEENSEHLAGRGKSADAPHSDMWRDPAELPEGLPWYTRGGHEILQTGDPGKIMRFYRAFRDMTQEKLAERIGVDRTSISNYERGERPLQDVKLRRLVADALEIPCAALGIDATLQEDHVAMLETGESVVRLARTAREQGCASESLRELDRLVNALEGRAQSGRATRGDMMLLASARAEVGVALGDLLPEAHLASAARWAGAGATVLTGLDGEPRRAAHALAMHGNELRKAGDLDLAVTSLRDAIELSPDLETRATAHLLLARAASVAHDTAQFDRSIRECRRALESDPSISNYFINPFSLREVELRGLLLTRRHREAEQVAGRVADAGTGPAAWGVLERVTMAQFYVAVGEMGEAADEIGRVIPRASALRLPHQVERAVRLAEDAHLYDLARKGQQAVRSMSHPLR